MANDKLQTSHRKWFTFTISVLLTIIVVQSTILYLHRQKRQREEKLGISFKQVIPQKSQHDVFSPIKEIEAMGERLDEFVNQSLHALNRIPPISPRAWHKLLDKDLTIINSSESYVVKLNMPGHDENQLDIKVDGRTLLIQGKKDKISQNKNQSEVFSSQFSQSISLPLDVNVETMTTEYKNNVLQIHFTKHAKYPELIKVS